MQRDVSRRGFLAGVGAVCAGSAAAGRVGGSGGIDDAGPGGSDGPGGGAVAHAAASAVQSDERRLADTVADLVASSLEEHDLPGATVAVVADGEVALAEGFGVADRASGRAVDAGTPFRIGSVSKAVTWTALMRRIQRGDLDPAADVTDYLDVPIPDGKGTPTVTDLATHRAGYEDGNSQLWIPDASGLESLPEHLRRATISQVRPPGEAGSYSNYGAAVGGQVLAAARGEGFATAIENELLGPAGMESSSFRQPLPESLAGNHATGHAVATTYPAGEFPYVGLRPAGAMSTTAADMARFLQAHVDDGVVDGERVLASETVAALHRQWATHHEALDGMAFGLVEDSRADARVLRHNGATVSFVSDVVLVPERGLGLFVAYNSTAGGEALGDVVDGFLAAALGEESDGTGGGAGSDGDGGGDADGGDGDGGDGDDSVGGSDGETLTPDGRPTRADALPGNYRSLRLSKTGHDRVTTTLQAPTVSVELAEDGALVTERGGETARWVETEPLVFEHVSENRRLAFRTEGVGEGTDGDVAYLFLGGAVSAYAPVEGVDRLSLHAALFAVTVLGMVSAVVGWPAAAVVRRYRAEGDPPLLPSRERLRTGPSAQARWVAGGAVFAFGAFVVLAAVHLGFAQLAVLSTPPLTFTALFALPVLGALGALAAVGYAAHALVRGSWSVVGRVHYVLVAGSLAGFAWLLAYWNLLLPP